MATLTPEQIEDLRADLGDQTEPYAFTESELQRLFTRADGDYYKTFLLALEQLTMNATKFYKYVAGFTRAEQDEIFEQLKAMLEYHTKKQSGTKQAFISGIAHRPPFIKEEPSDA